jgi:hypothetical protein
LPYSITTRDGITIGDIPDDMPADHPDLKARVATIRGQGKPQPSQPASDVQAPSNGYAMGFRDPIDAGAQILRRVVGDKVGDAIDTFGNYLASKGLPVAPSSGVQGVDRIVNQVNDQYEAGRKAAAGGEDPGFDGKRLIGNLANPVNYVGGGGVAGANTVKNLAIAGAKAGVVSGVMQPVVGAENQQEFWTNKAEQAGAGAVSGAVMTPVIGKAVEKGATAAVNAVRSARPAPSDSTIRIAVNNTINAAGMDPREVPEAILQSVNRQVSEALNAGRRVNPQEVMRAARFEAVGLTGDAAPTAAQLSRNPTQYANEINLSQVRMTTPQGEGNALADRFNAQNRRLQDVFNLAGAREATDNVTAGNTILGALRDADAPVRGRVDDLYTAARGMNEGRAWDLERGVFSQNANRALDEGMWGAFVPPEVRTLLNSITEGSTPFNVDAAVQIDTLLSKAQRKAERAGDDAGASAVGVIRTALHNTPLVEQQAAGRAASAAAHTVEDLHAPGPSDVPFREINPPALPAPPGSALAVRDGGQVGPVLPQVPPAGAGSAQNAGDQARAAFDQARRAARDRFATIEATPALKAALDEAAPDKFVQNFILNANAEDVQAMRQILANSPEALRQARAQIAAHLRRAAFGEGGSADQAFTPKRYEGVLRAIGPQKLQAFFAPEEILRFNLAGQVASDMNSIPAGAKPNLSGTGGALFNLLSRITESPIVRQIPGARSISNQVTEIRNERAINEALRPAAGSAQPARQLTPEQMRALQLLFPPAGVAGGVLAGSAVN